MDPPHTDLSSSCSHCDAELVHKISQILLQGLATACVDSTTGDFFHSPSTVAIEIRKEMLGYLAHRSESYFSDLFFSHHPNPNPNPNPCEPLDIISDLIEDFVASKRNLFTRVSGWIMNEAREDRIDEFVREMDANRFWTIDRREAVSEALIRNLDYKNEWHCAMRFGDEGEREVHVGKCGFRPVGCWNEGCRVRFCAARREEHEEVCGYKVMGCDQKCGEMVLRREMDRHCVTVCGMKLVNCPFYSVGCESGVPRCRIEEHCRDDLRRHLICVLDVVHRDEEGSEDVWEERAKALEEVQSENELAEALNVRALITAIKKLEAKMIKSGEDDSYSSRLSN